MSNPFDEPTTATVTTAPTSNGSGTMEHEIEARRRLRERYVGKVGYITGPKGLWTNADGTPQEWICVEAGIHVTRRDGAGQTVEETLQLEVETVERLITYRQPRVINQKHYGAMKVVRNKPAQSSTGLDPSSFVPLDVQPPPRVPHVEHVEPWMDWRPDNDVSLEPEERPQSVEDLFVPAGATVSDADKMRAELAELKAQIAKITSQASTNPF